jgi:hypothetical protein
MVFCGSDISAVSIGRRGSLIGCAYAMQPHQLQPISLLIQILNRLVRASGKGNCSKGKEIHFKVD